MQLSLYQYLVCLEDRDKCFDLCRLCGLNRTQGWLFLPGSACKPPYPLRQQMVTPTWPGPGPLQKNKAHKVPYSTNDHPLKSRRSGNFGGYNLKCRVPSAEDLVFSSTASVLEAFNQKDFHHKADRIRIHAYSTTPTIFYDYESAPAVHMLRRTKT